MPHFVIDGRDVFHRLGRKTQTVNICTPDNVEGRYEDRYTLHISVNVPAAELAAQPDLSALREWLMHHGAEPLPTDARPGQRLPSLVPAAVASDQWMAEARAAVERVLVTAVDSFLERPYLHRVEHSLHSALWAMLKQDPVLQGDFELEGGKVLTQLVHREWPETRPRKKMEGGGGRPRGLFDLAILSPEQMRQADLDQFTFGRIEAPIVIEVGLDYGCAHSWTSRARTERKQKR